MIHNSHDLVEIILRQVFHGKIVVKLPSIKSFARQIWPKSKQTKQSKQSQLTRNCRKHQI